MRRTMIAAALALAATALPCAARADGAAVPPAPGGGFDLVAGRDYALLGGSEADDTVDLLDPAGRVVAKLATNGDMAHATEFRARYTARYFLRDHDPTAGLSAGILYDCRGDARTKCRISIHHTRAGLLDWANDVDFYAVKLVGGWTYRITARAPPGAEHNAVPEAFVVDPRGRMSARNASEGAPLTYRAASSGTYFVAMFNGSIDFGGPYQLSVVVAGHR